MRTGTLRTIAVALACAIGWMTAPGARADLPTVDELLDLGGFSKADAAKAKAGGIIRGSMEASNERELVATLAFVVKESPSELSNRASNGLLMKVDENVITWGAVDAGSAEASFAKFALKPDAEKRAKRYGKASAGGDLNLSKEEISRFEALGGGATPAAVEPILRETLAKRISDYRARGLSGIAPYARGGDSRSAGDDLRSATAAAKVIEKWVPAAYRMFADYPKSRAEGSREHFTWSQINAHDVPTLILTHGVMVPEGDAWVVMQRQFYVSEGYNCEQALAVFLPVTEGTAVFYVNRTSTDQVSGFGGGAKRSIGSKLLASQLEGIMGRVQEK